MHQSISRVRSFVSKNSILSVSFLVLAGALVAGVASAATTISTDIDTGGQLSVTGTSSLMGNVGIGTNNPQYNVDVNGNLNIQNSTGINEFRMTQDDTHRYFELRNVVGNSSLGAFTRTDLQFRLVNAYGDGFGQRFSFWMNNVEKMTLEYNGYLGIGTTTPTTPLQVSTTATTTASVMSTSGNKGGRLVLMDTNGTTCTEITTNAGVLSGKAVPCP